MFQIKSPADSTVKDITLVRPAFLPLWNRFCSVLKKKTQMSNHSG